MLRVTCPQCGHENRPSIAATICDRCGEDISVLAPAQQPPEAAPARVEPPPQPEPTPAPREPAKAAEAVRKPALAKRAVSLLGRLLLASLAIALGVFVSQTIRIGTALSADPQIGGSVAILAVAAGMIGLVLMLVGSGAGRSQAITVGGRLLGFVLATCGVFVAVAVLTHGVVEQEELARPPIGMPDTMPMMPEDSMPGPLMDPETG
jgi:hypothetical protein